MINFYTHKTYIRSFRWPIDPCEKLATAHDAAGALFPERGWAGPASAHGSDFFFSLHDQWKPQHDRERAEAEQRLHNYVRVQERSVHTKHRIPEVI